MKNKKTPSSLNLDIRTFIIKFRYKSTDSMFLFQDGRTLVGLLKSYDKTGVEYIKELDVVSNKFKRVSKKDLLGRFSWEAEAIQYLMNHYYFN